MCQDATVANYLENGLECSKKHSRTHLLEVFRMYCTCTKDCQSLSHYIVLQPLVHHQLYWSYLLITIRGHSANLYKLIICLTLPASVCRVLAALQTLATGRRRGGGMCARLAADRTRRYAGRLAGRTLAGEAATASQFWFLMPPP